MAELADDRAVEFQLVNFAGDGPRARGVSIRIGVGSKYVLVRPLRNTDRPANSKVLVGLDWFQIVVEDLVSEIGAIGNPHVALPVDLQAMRKIELARTFARLFTTRLGQESADRKS